MGVKKSVPRTGYTYTSGQPPAVVRLAVPPQRSHQGSLMRATRLAVLALLLGATALAGCDKARQAAGTETATSCIGCHGGYLDATGAPPNDTQGNTATTFPGVGAHTKHIEAGYDCEACHVKPSRLRDPGHIDGEAKITFGQMARKPDAALTPSFDKTTHTCSNVYCHGGRLPAGDRGQATTPSWTASPLPGAPCASCHGTVASFGAPPAPGHPGGFTGTSDCNRCHPGTVDGDGNLILVGKGGQHLDGEVQIAASACNLCHGDRNGTRVADAGKPAAYAPPFAVDGATTGVKVGAHLRHVSAVAGSASRVSQPFACTECHVYPGSSGPHVVAPGTVVDFDVAHTSVATAGGQCR